MIPLARRHESPRLIVSCDSHAAQCVRRVIGWGACTEMIWPNTTRVVAGMQAMPVTEVGACSQLVREPMSQYQLLSDREDSVSRGLVSTRPNPAVFGLLDMIPEVHSRVALWHPRAVGCRAESPITALHNIGSREKLHTAISAYPGDHCSTHE